MLTCNSSSSLTRDQVLMKLSFRKARMGELSRTVSRRVRPEPAQRQKEKGHLLVGQGVGNPTIHIIIIFLYNVYVYIFLYFILCEKGIVLLLLVALIWIWIFFTCPLKTNCDEKCPSYLSMTDHPVLPTTVWSAPVYSQILLSQKLQ